MEEELLGMRNWHEQKARGMHSVVCRGKAGGYEGWRGGAVRTYKERNEKGQEPGGQF